MKTTDTISIKGLSKSLGDFNLNIPELSLQKNALHGIIGANGCGKTTLFKLVAGLMQPDTGTITHGLDPQNITMLFRKPYMINDTVENNLRYPYKLRKIKPDPAQLDHYLTLAGLVDKRHQNARALSGGAMQKLALVRALSFSPKLILLDESFSNMDIESVAFFEDYILSAQQELNATWLIISHQLSNIKRLCSHTHFMHQGRVQLSDSTEHVFEQPQTEELKRFLRYYA